MKKIYLAITVLVVAGIAVFVIMKQNQTSHTPTSTNDFQVSEENTIIYTGSGYSPSELVVEVGTTVTFVNQSDLPMWTASNPHPDHRRGVKTGETYEFTFEEAGIYKYHNHLSPQHTGAIIVE